MQQPTLSVSQLNEYLRMLMESDAVLSEVAVGGEISNLTVSRPGHIYFTLKDADGQLRSVMFRSAAARLTFRPTDGMRVIAYGRVSLYSPSGQYQLYVEALREDGAGQLALQFERLRRSLEAEGLFDASRKKPLPPYPMRVGIITSPYGAAVRDLIRILGRRFPAAELRLFPSLVQGSEAPAQLIEGLRFFETTNSADVIILGRGGGSAEDLWAFNDEELVRAVAACSIPVISAVGHENDYTLCDYVADLRASTPSAAAELAVPERTELLSFVEERRSRMQVLLRARLEHDRRMLLAFSERGMLAHPERILQPIQIRLDAADRGLGLAMQESLERASAALLHKTGRLEALSPLSVLQRGYAAVRRGEQTVTRARALSVGEEIQLRFSDGSVTGVITEGVRENREEKKQ